MQAHAEIIDEGVSTVLYLRRYAFVERLYAAIRGRLAYAPFGTADARHPARSDRHGPEHPAVTMTRHVTAPALPVKTRSANPDSTGRDDPDQRFRLYRLCPCAACEGTGKSLFAPASARCPNCRGEGRTLDLLATAPSPEAVGLAIVTMAREGELDECPLGLLDTAGEVNQKWLVSPWLPSPRNASDAGRLLASLKAEKARRDKEGSAR